MERQEGLWPEHRNNLALTCLYDVEGVGSTSGTEDFSIKQNINSLFQLGDSMEEYIPSLETAARNVDMHVGREIYRVIKSK